MDNTIIANDQTSSKSTQTCTNPNTTAVEPQDSTNVINQDDIQPSGATKRGRSEAQQQKRILKKQKTKIVERIHKNCATRAEYYLSTFGKFSDANVQIKIPNNISPERFYLRPQDFQLSLLWTIKMLTQQPEWYHFEHRPLIDNVVIVVLDGLNKFIFEEYRSLLTFFSNELNNQLVPYSSTSSLYSNIMSITATFQNAISKIPGFKPDVHIGKVNLISENNLPTGNTNNINSNNNNQRTNQANKDNTNKDKDNTNINQTNNNNNAGVTTTTTTLPPQTTTTTDPQTQSTNESNPVSESTNLPSQPTPTIQPFVIPDKKQLDFNYDLVEKTFLHTILYSHALELSATDNDLDMSEFPSVEKNEDFVSTLPLEESNQKRSQLFDKYPSLFKRIDPPAAMTNDNDTCNKGTSKIDELFHQTVPPPPITQNDQYINSLQIDQYPSTPYFLPVSSFTDNSPAYNSFVGLDCEMVKGLNDVTMLARVSLVDAKGHQITDFIVEPSGPITNYLTQYSGISPETYSPESGNTIVTFDEAQDIVLSLLSRDHILVGHGLENDLRILKIIHRNILDTTLLYPHRKGGLVKNSLKFLTRVHLRQAIQQDHTQGHDSIEDSQSAVRLAIKKLVMGANYGVQNSLSMFDIFDFFKIPSTFLATGELCRRLAAGSTDCVVTDSFKSKAILDWISSFVKRNVEKLKRESPDYNNDNTPLLPPPRSNNHSDSGNDDDTNKNDTNNVDTSAEGDSKHCVVAHMTELLLKIEKLWEKTLLQHYCMPHSQYIDYNIHPDKYAEQKLEKDMADKNNKVENDDEDKKSDDNSNNEMTDSAISTTSTQATITNPTTSTMNDTNNTNPSTITNEVTPAGDAQVPQQQQQQQQQPRPHYQPQWQSQPILPQSPYRSLEWMVDSQPLAPDFTVLIKQLNQQLIDFWATLEPNTVVYFISGSGPTSQARFLTQMAKDLRSGELYKGLENNNTNNTEQSSKVESGDNKNNDNVSSSSSSLASTKPISNSFLLEPNTKLGLRYQKAFELHKQLTLKHQEAQRVAQETNEKLALLHANGTNIPNFTPVAPTFEYNSSNISTLNPELEFFQLQANNLDKMAKQLIHHSSRGIFGVGVKATPEDVAQEREKIIAEDKKSRDSLRNGINNSSSSSDSSDTSDSSDSSDSD